AIAADPRAPAQERGQAPALAKPGLESVLDRAVHARRDLEQRAAEYVERGLDLVERRGLVRARILGRVQREHLGVERDVTALGSLIEELADARQVIERGAAARLRRMRGDQRHHEVALGRS